MHKKRKFNKARKAAASHRLIGLPSEGSLWEALPKGVGLGLLAIGCGLLSLSLGHEWAPVVSSIGVVGGMLYGNLMHKPAPSPATPDTAYLFSAVNALSAKMDTVATGLKTFVEVKTDALATALVSQGQLVQYIAEVAQQSKEMADRVKTYTDKQSGV